MSGAFAFDRAVPWGRDRAEYEAFFGLGDVASGTRVLDCGGGPSSFTAEMARAGYHATAADPLYHYTADDIAARVDAAGTAMLDGMRAARDRFVWTRYGSPEQVVEVRLETLRRFLADYEPGRAEGRYVAAALPDLPFEDGVFDLALSSHFLFLYSAQLDVDFHVAAIAEMLRVGREARLFPLVDLDGAPSSHLEPVRKRLAALGLDSTVERVAYEFQKGANSMLRVRMTNPAGP